MRNALVASREVTRFQAQGNVAKQLGTFGFGQLEAQFLREFAHEKALNDLDLRDRLFHADRAKENMSDALGHAPSKGGLSLGKIQLRATGIALSFFVGQTA